MSKVTRCRIPLGLTERVIDSVVREVEADQSAVDRVDVERIKNKDGLVLREILYYLDENGSINCPNNNEWDNECVNKITSSIINTLKWRASYGINQMKSEDFPTAFYKSNPFTACRQLYNKDTIVLVRDESKHEKVSNEWNVLLERFWMYFTEKVTSQYFNEGKDVLYLMDFTQFGVKNLDSNLCLSFYSVIGKYFPRITLESSAIDMPWYAKPVMKLVLKILPPSVSRNFKLISSKDLANRLGDHCLPVCFGGQNKYEETLGLPSRFVSIQEIGEKNGIPQEDIDRMMKHLRQQ